MGFYVVLFQKHIEAGSGQAGYLTGFLDVTRGNDHQVLYVLLFRIIQGNFPHILQLEKCPGRFGHRRFFVLAAASIPTEVRSSHMRI